MFLLAHRPSSGDERGETSAVRRIKKNASRTVALKLQIRSSQGENKLCDLIFQYIQEKN